MRFPTKPHFIKKQALRLLHAFFWALIICSLPACQKENRFDCFKSTGHTKTEIRLLPAFQQIQVFDNITVELVKDTACFIEIIAGENLIENITTEVSGNTLTLQNINKCNWVRSYKREITAVVHAPSFTRIIHDGIKTVRTRGLLVQDTIRLDITDAGDFNMNLNSNKVYATMYEYGNITLHGSASLFVFENYNVGKIYAQQMPAGTILGVVEGQGENHVKPTEFISVTFKGSGNVYYYQPGVNAERLGPGPGRLIPMP